jgi:hypothetical protein
MKQIKKANLFDSFEIVNLEEKMEFSGGPVSQGIGVSGGGCPEQVGSPPAYDPCGGGGE